MSDPTWPALLGGLLEKEDLSRAQAAWAMGQIMAGEATESQIAAFVVALRAKGETPDEVAGLVDTMRAHAEPIVVPGLTLDIVGTGGDHSNSVNVSTMAAVVAAAAGARVVKHGNRAASSQCGSADVLEALGVVIDLEPELVATCVETVGIGFCFAPRFHPAMRHAASARRSIGVPTIFNVLGPLANPARPTAALIGCADARLAPVMAAVLADAGQRAIVVRGDGGLDEVTTSGPTTVWDATHAEVSSAVLDPALLGFVPPPPGALAGGDAQRNAQVARDVLGRSNAPDVLAVRDVVVLNAAVALVSDQAARSGDAENSQAEFIDRVAAAIDRARDAIDSGRAGKLLGDWVAITQQLASER